MAQYETSLVTLELQATGDSPESVADDRRRLGRSDYVNPALIPLLRTAPTPALPLDDTDLVQDQKKLAPAAAIGVIALLSTFLWGTIGFIGWAIVH